MHKQKREMTASIATRKETPPAMPARNTDIKTGLPNTI
jgi:hypothetical protein